MKGSTMDLMIVYSKCIGNKFKKLKKIAIIVFIAGCFVNPILSDLAFFIVGASVGFLGLLMGLEKAVKNSLLAADKMEMKGDNIHIFIKDKKLEIIVNKDSNVLLKSEFEGEDVLILNSGPIIYKADK